MTDADAAGTTVESPGETTTSGGDAGDGGSGSRNTGRDVVVPMRLYKTVTVFSTLIAVVSVVLGFMLLDAATLNVSFLGALATGLLAAVGLSVADGLLSTVFAAAGLGVIGFGAGVYVVGTRFRAEGMGKPQEDSDEASDTDG
jgi:hypothetical protein